MFTGELRSAISAFERGVGINSALTGSWSTLERLYRLSGDEGKAQNAAAQLAMLRRLPSQIVQGGSLFCDGELAAAVEILRLYLRTFGAHPEALRLLGRIAHQQRHLGEADSLLTQALTLAPGYRALRADCIRVWIDRQRYVRAQQEIASLLELDPDNGDYRTLRATVCAGLGDHERAIDLYRELIAAAPDWPHLPLLLGHSLRSVGRQEEAIRAYRAAAAIRPDFGDAYWSLANLKTYRFTSQEIESMLTHEAASATQPVDRSHLCFSLGKAFEDQGEYAESWRYYQRGNTLQHAHSRYDPTRTEGNLRGQMATFTAEFLAARGACGLPDQSPIFIVGLPRAGSTLVEQILASHSQVEATRELQDIDSIVAELQLRAGSYGDSRYPAMLAELKPQEFRRLGEKYIADTRGYRRGKPVFIDKMPDNFRHIGLIHLMLPQAKIIDVRREPLACCFSNLKQLYAGGREFSYDMEGIAHYYRTYLELMRHWDRVLPGRVLHVQYEDTVENLDSSVRLLLQHCGLRFEPACIEFHRTVRSISTASSEQVRQPVFRSGLSQWRCYEAWLDPLKQALGDVLNHYRE